MGKIWEKKKSESHCRGHDLTHRNSPRAQRKANKQMQKEVKLQSQCEEVTVMSYASSGPLQNKPVTFPTVTRISKQEKTGKILPQRWKEFYHKNYKSIMEEI